MLDTKSRATNTGAIVTYRACYNGRRSGVWCHAEFIHSEGWTAKSNSDGHAKNEPIHISLRSKKTKDRKIH